MDRCCIGIDIGSSFTKAAAVIGKGNPTPIKNIEDGTNSFRSLIYFPTDEEDVIIGETAFYEIEFEPERVFRIPVEQLELGHDNKKIIDGREYEPVTLAALMVQKIKMAASIQGVLPNDVVFTMPNWFGVYGKTSLKYSGLIADLNVADVIFESVASVIWLLFHKGDCFQNNKNKVSVLVFNSGASSFDLSIISIWKSEDSSTFHVEICDNDGALGKGGDYIDSMICKILSEQYSIINFLDNEPLDEELLQQLLRKAETIKCKLSYCSSINTAIYYDCNKTVVKTSREDLERIISVLVESIKECAGNLIKRNSYKINDIDFILLTGGSSRIPYIQSMFEVEFPQKDIIIAPSECASIGAAIYCQQKDNFIVHTPMEKTYPLPCNISGQ